MILNTYTVNPGALMRNFNEPNPLTALKLQVLHEIKDILGENKHIEFNRVYVSAWVLKNKKKHYNYQVVVSETICEAKHYTKDLCSYFPDSYAVKPVEIYLTNAKGGSIIERHGKLPNFTEMFEAWHGSLWGRSEKPNPVELELPDNFNAGTYDPETAGADTFIPASDEEMKNYIESLPHDTNWITETPVPESATQPDFVDILDTMKAQEAEARSQMQNYIFLSPKLRRQLKVAMAFLDRDLEEFCNEALRTALDEQAKITPAVGVVKKLFK